MNLVALYRRLRAHFDQEHRYRHTIGVARTADLLAQRHGIDPARARIAGLLHDLARLFPGDRLIAECEARRMPIDAFERAHPIVLHARLSAEIARESYAVDDPQILSAIRTHTLGASRMSPLDKVVFLADALEPGRDFTERAALYQTALRDLDAATIGVLQSTVAYLRKRGLSIAPQTAAALARYQPTHV